MSAHFVSVYVSQVLARIKHTLDRIPAATGDSVLLDIGCYGPLLGVFRDLLGYNRMRAIAKDEWGPCERKVLPAWASSAGIDLEIWIGDIEKNIAPWADESIDVALMLEILEHFAIDPVHPVLEASRLLKPGGTVVLTTPNACATNALLRMITGNNPYDCTGFNGVDTNRHNRLYTAYEIEQLLECCGFGNISVESFDERPRLDLGKRADLGRQLISLIGSGAASRMRGDTLLATATKIGNPRERFPSFLYPNKQLYKEWEDTVHS